MKFIIGILILGLILISGCKIKKEINDCDISEGYHYYIINGTNKLMKDTDIPLLKISPLNGSIKNFPDKESFKEWEEKTTKEWEDCIYINEEKWCKI